MSKHEKENIPKRNVTGLNHEKDTPKRDVPNLMVKLKHLTDYRITDNRNKERCQHNVTKLIQSNHNTDCSPQTIIQTTYHSTQENSVGTSSPIETTLLTSKQHDKKRCDDFLKDSTTGSSESDEEAVFRVDVSHEDDDESEFECMNDTDAESETMRQVVVSDIDLECTNTLAATTLEEVTETDIVNDRTEIGVDSQTASSNPTHIELSKMSEIKTPAKTVSVSHNKVRPDVVRSITPIRKHSSSIPLSRPKTTPRRKKAPAVSPSRTRELDEGRPSIGTLTEQWMFMRSIFVGNNEEELEWLMVSKKGSGAYHHAHKKYVEAENKYYESMYSTAKYSTMVEHVSGVSAEVPSLLAQMAKIAPAVGATNRHPEKTAELIGLYNKTWEYVDRHREVLNFFKRSKPSFDSRINASAKLAKWTVDTFKLVQEDVKAVQTNLTDAQRQGDKALLDMEKWLKREKETDDYNVCMRAIEDEWLTNERVANEEALITMRTFIPVTIADMTVQEVMAEAREKQGLLSIELAAELKSNRLLQWLVLHEQDIALASFLTGEKKTYFENLESYDVLELRAIAACLPSRFDNDNDGKKAEWRSRLINRAKQLASQDSGDTVLGQWEETKGGGKGGRVKVQLPPLRPEQKRRSVYFYRTKEQFNVKLAQYEKKSALLSSKAKLLQEVEISAADAKTEYDTILRDMRDPDILAQLSDTTQLTSIKDKAKKDWSDLERKRKQLDQEVARMRKSIEDAPISEQEFKDMAEEVRLHLELSVGINWDAPGLSPILISGPFDGKPDIVPIERSAAKFTSAEEEAALRKQELSQLMLRVETPTALDIVETSDVVSACTGNIVSSKIREAELASVVTANTTVASAHNTTTRRRNSVLEAHPELLSTLNKMFSSPSAETVGWKKSATHRQTLHAGSSNAPLQLATLNSEDIAAKTPKKTQSKLLMQLLNGATSSPLTTTRVADVPKLSFLDEIKSKKTAIATAAQGSTNELSIFDQIKSRGASRSEI